MKQVTRDNVYLLNDLQLEKLAHIALDKGFDFVHLDELVNALYLHNAGSVVEIRLSPYGSNVDYTIMVNDTDCVVKHKSFCLNDENDYDEFAKELGMISKMDNQGWFDVMHDFAEKVSADKLHRYKRKQEESLRDISYALRELSEML